MNKQLEEYKRKANRIIKTLIAIFCSIFVLGLLISIIQYTMNKSKSVEESLNSPNGQNEYIIDLEDNSIIYENNIELNVTIVNFEIDKNYKIRITVDDDNIDKEEEMSEKQNTINIEIKDQGRKNLKIYIYENDEEKLNTSKTIYYIKPYQPQFLDKLENDGVQMHIRDGTRENYKVSIELYKNTGGRYIREDFLLLDKYLEDNDKDYAIYDKWINEIYNNGLKLIMTLNGTNTGFSGTEGKINTDEEIDKFVEISKKIAKRYPFVEDYELMNEPNLGANAYVTDEELNYYTKLLVKLNEELKKINPKINITTGGNTTLKSLTDKTITSEDFIKKVNEFAKGKHNVYGYHPYDNENKALQNGTFYNLLNSHKKVINQLGGFSKHYVTEYGVSSSESYSITEEMQAEKLVQQNVIVNKENIDLVIRYNFWNTADDTYYSGRNYGMVRNDYTPKPSYYSTKNFYENTNGAEYIGNLNWIDNLETHIYDKDGKPIIIAWSNNTNNIYDFSINNMNAKDLYGKEIQPNENGQIKITTSPVYLYNADNQCFFQAISNVATEKYREFKEQFSEQIAKVPDLMARINSLEQNAKDIYNKPSISQETAIDLMKQHYNLGNMIISAYKSKNLQIEYVSLSSMLDMLDDIGESYEDLVTVTAKARNANLTETEKLITEVESLINNNQDLEIIYPSKILEFSKDYNEKANYINNLTEENDIKTGLIVSKNLHSLLLANWAKEFTNLYIEEYIEKNPVEVKYSTTDITNQDVTATLVTNANIQVTNNSNSKEYVFKNNNTFEFEYTIKGQSKKIKAIVNNIDKTSPKISQVQNDRLYIDVVTPKVSDENLLKVELYKDSRVVENYQLNTSVVEDGSYKIVALDKAGNETSIEFYISRKPVDITYSETSVTNKDVTATLTSNFDFEVNNNSHQKKYTFVENDTFEFNCTIKGTNLKLTATVNNIDKKAPSITGVENEKIYMNYAKPIITDENLQDVKLYHNEIVVQNYKVNSEIKEEGIYKIIATDKAGNRTTINFYIMTNPSKEYQMKDSYILNINYNTYKYQFDEKFNTATKYKILRKGKAITDQDKIITGDILQSENGKSYTLIVNGDINKDGEINIFDLNKLRICILKNEFDLDEEQKLAADSNLDGQELGIKDLVRLRILILTKDTNL